jgi:hypothetical protein
MADEANAKRIVRARAASPSAAKPIGPRRPSTSQQRFEFPPRLADRRRAMYGSPIWSPSRLAPRKAGVNASKGHSALLPAPTLQPLE